MPSDGKGKRGGGKDRTGWNDKAEMDKTMEEAVSLQPAAN